MNKHIPDNLLEFPCYYQFKAIGVSGEGFRDKIVAAIKKYAIVNSDAVRCQPSGKGHYQSVTVLTTLYNYQQLTDIYAEMKRIPDLKMLL